MGKPERKRALGRRRRRWEDGIRMDLMETGWGSVDWIQLAQDRDRWQAVVYTVMNLQVLAPRSWLVLYVNLSVHRPIKWPAWLFLLFFKQHAIKAYRSGEVSLHALTVVLYTLPVAFNSRQTFPTHSERFVCAHMITIVNIPLQWVRVQVVGTDCGT
jgi:hypothetical protein